MPKFKYFYKGMPLMDYCKLHNLDYFVIYARIRRLEKKGIIITEEVMDEIIKKAKRDMNYYTYKGIPLYTYCKLHNIPYKRVYRKIKKWEIENPNLLVTDEVIENIINEARNTTTFQIKYYWDNMPLCDYCKLHEIPYESIQKRIKKNDSDNSTDIKIANALKLYLPNGIKYYVGEKTFVEFCKEEKLDYKWGIKLLRANYEMSNVIEILRKNRDKIIQREMKEFLLTNLNNEDVLLNFARYSHFSIDNIKTIINEGLPLGNAVMLIHYLGTENELHEKSVSLNIIKDIVELLNAKEELDLEKLLLLDGIGFIGYRYHIKKWMGNIIHSTINKHISPSEGIYSLAYQYLEDGIDYVLKRNFINNPGGFVNYCKKVFYGWLMRFLKELSYKVDIENMQLKNNFNLEDYYLQKESNKKIYEVIQDLSEEEQKYIIIKYGFLDDREKTDEEMLQYFPNFTLADLIAYGNSVIQKLLENEEIKQLKYNQ